MSALERLGEAIEAALGEEEVGDVLSVLTGALVGLTVELCRRKGVDATLPITLDGGMQRNVTIHPPKAAGSEGGAA